MNERELLEAAARAAELEFHWIKVDGGHLMQASEPGSRSEESWNPLTDDGDAFRLAMKLDLKMHHGYTQNHVGPAAFAGDGEQFCIEFHEDYADGKCGAMRRAITRYAATIGKKVDAPLVRAD